MNHPRLSICIPTYNFAAFIGPTLDSIVPQLTPAVEVIILDGGSTDDTAAVVGRYAEACPTVRFVRQAQRGGIDRDIARSVDLAAADYCWLFSADDIMQPGAIARVLAETETGYDVYLCGLTLCDLEMRPIAQHRVSRAAPGSTFDLADADDRRRYFELAETSTAFFSFMGSVIVRRARWMQIGLDEAFVGTLWSLSVRILQMIPTGLTVKYVGEPLLSKRGDNDSFMDKGLAHRFSIAIDGYHRIASELFGSDSFEAQNIRRVIVNEFPPNAFLLAKSQLIASGRRQALGEIDRLAAKTFSDRGLRNAAYRLICRHVPVRVYEAARPVIKSIRGWLRPAPRP
jgi:abequosyltransferase